MRGSEVDNARFPYWDLDIRILIDNIDSCPELVELLSDESEDVEKELLEVIRKGLWPVLDKVNES